MKYFVTGATGFIGYHLVNSLVGRGHQVHALCRSEEKASKLPEGVKVFFGSIMDAGIVRKGMEGCDYVYHLAAYARVWARDNGKFYKVNVEGTNIVLDAARDLGVRRVVVVSTAGVFGASFDDIIDEGFVRRKDFFNEYEGSKALSESHIKNYVIEGLDVVIVSPTRVYGHYFFGAPESVSLLIKKYVEGGWRFFPGPPNRIGNYVFVGDVVTGMQLAMDKGRRGSTYILGGENHTYRSFFEVLSSVSGIRRRMFRIPLFISYFFAWIQLVSALLFGVEPLVTPKWIAKAKYHWKVSSANAASELEYKITSLRDGLQQTIAGLNR